jgi:hypothetical protein
MPVKAQTLCRRQALDHGFLCGESDSHRRTAVRLAGTVFDFVFGQDAPGKPLSPAAENLIETIDIYNVYANSTDHSIPEYFMKRQVNIYDLLLQQLLLDCLAILMYF